MPQRYGKIAAHYSDVFERREAAEKELSNLQARGQLLRLNSENIIQIMGGWVVGISADNRQ